MAIDIKAKDLTEMWRKTNKTLWEMEDEDFDFVRRGVTVHSFHNQMFAESAAVDLPLHLLGYTKTKWSMLLKLYFNADSYRLIIHRLKFFKKEGRGHKFVVDIPMQFNSRFNRTGECLMGMTIRYSLKWGWECEVFTRASESISRWGVDLSFLYVLLREIGKEVGFEPEGVRVFWNSAQMFQSIITAPLYHLLSDKEKDLHKTPKTEWQEYVMDRYRTAFIGVDGKRKYANYKTQARAVKAYEIWKGDREPRHILTLEDLYLPPVDLELPEKFMKMGGFK